MILDFKNRDFLVVKNFIDEEIMNKLNSWCLNNFHNNFFSDANMGLPNTRLTTRYSDANTFSFPKEAYTVQERIINFFNLKKFLLPPFKDGIVCGIGFNGGDIYEHIDPVWYAGTVTVHFNILSQKSLLGGNIFINGAPVEVKEGDLLCFKVSEDLHSVDTIVGDRERILWVFGFSIPEEFVV